MPANANSPKALSIVTIALRRLLLHCAQIKWFTRLVAYGELLVGVALIVGAFTGIAAFFGAVMNWNFMMAGSASTNPLLFAVAILLVLAWKVAGYFGADYLLLRRLGTPWQPVAPTAVSTLRTTAPTPVAGD